MIAVDDLRAILEQFDEERLDGLDTSKRRYRNCRDPSVLG